MSIRDDLIAIIGYQAETCLPDEKPIIAYYTDRHLSPILDELVAYVETQRTAEPKMTCEELGYHRCGPDEGRVSE